MPSRRASPLVSILLAVKNSLPHLKKAIEAIRRQRYAPFEVIVQDGASTDGTLEYLSSLGLDNFNVASEPDRGIGQAYNRALQRSAGELVCFASSDEHLEDDALENSVGWFSRSPHAVAINGAVRLVDQNDEVVQIFQPPHFDLLRHLENEVVLPFAGLINRNKVGGDCFYDESLKTCPDYDFWIRLGTRFDKADFIVVPEVFKTARADRASMSYRSESFDQFCRDKFFVLNRFLLGQPPGPLTAAIRRAATTGIFAWAAESVLQLEGPTAAFMKWCHEAVKSDPWSPRVAALAVRSHAFNVEPSSGRFDMVPDRQPIAPPGATSSADGWVQLDAIFSSPLWRGAHVVRNEEIEVGTGTGSWSYAAQIPLTIAEPMDPHRWYWVRLQLEVLSGQMSIGLLAGQAMIQERIVSASKGDTSVFLNITSPDATAIIVRNGALNESSRARFSRATVESCERSSHGTDGAVTLQRFE